MAWLSTHAPLGVERAAYYTTAPLRETLSDLVDLEHCRRAQDRASRSAPSTSATARCATSTAATRRVGTRPRAGFGRAAAGVPRGAHRRRPVLGRRHLLEHADRGGARRQAAPGLADLHGPHVEPRRPRARDALAGDGPAEGHPVREPRRATSRGRSRSTTCATSSASCEEAAGRRRATRRRRRSSRRGAAARRCTSRGCSRPSSTARTTPRTSTSRRPASARAGRPATPTRMRMLERAPWQRAGRPDRRRGHPRSGARQEARQDRRHGD